MECELNATSNWFNCGHNYRTIYLENYIIFYLSLEQAAHTDYDCTVGCFDDVAMEESQLSSTYTGTLAPSFILLGNLQESLSERQEAMGYPADCLPFLVCRLNFY